MLHLFNKVYLEFDDNIEIHFDRVVISEKYGLPMYQALDKVAYGELHGHGLNFDEVVGGDFVGFLSSLKNVSDNSGKKTIIYCDVPSYKKVMGHYFKLILPDLDLESFKNIVQYTTYNQRIISNTQLSSVYSKNLNSAWSGLGDAEELWESLPEFTPEKRESFLNLQPKLSYEFLLASYLHDGSKKEEFKSTMHMFLRRWWTEMFIDNRQMVLLNLSNHKLMDHLGVDVSLIDLSAEDPIENVPQLASYSDNKIWETTEGTCKIAGLSKTKASKLLKTLNTVFEYEGIHVDFNQFANGEGFLNAACASTMDDVLMDELLEYVVQNPFDTCFVPRFDFQNVNFPLLQYFLSLKFNNGDLSKYRLL